MFGHLFPSAQDGAASSASSTFLRPSFHAPAGAVLQMTQGGAAAGAGMEEGGRKRSGGGNRAVIEGLNPIRSGISSLTAAVCTCALLHPFDLIKTRMQVSSVSGSAIPAYRDTASAARAILEVEGVRGLYKGLSATLIASGISWGVFRFLFDVTRKQMMEGKGENSEGLGSLAFHHNLVASLLASLLSTVKVHPLWLVKTRMELQSFESKAAGWTQYSGWRDCVKTIARKEGLWAMYKGIGPALGLVPHAAVQMLLYEELKATEGFGLNGGPFDPLRPFVWGAGSKFVAILLTYPLQVIRSRQQMFNSKVSGQNFITVGKDLVRTEGVRSLYSGLAVHVQRACLHNGLLFLLFEGFSNS